MGIWLGWFLPCFHLEFIIIKAAAVKKLILSLLRTMRVSLVPWVGLWLSQKTLSRLAKLIFFGWKTTLTTSAWPVLPAKYNVCEFMRDNRCHRGQLIYQFTVTNVVLIINVWGPSNLQLSNIFLLQIFSFWHVYLKSKGTIRLWVEYKGDCLWRVILLTKYSQLKVNLLVSSITWQSLLNCHGTVNVWTFYYRDFFLKKS